jgi:hypothetical protein
LYHLILTSAHLMERSLLHTSPIWRNIEKQ